MFVATGGAQTPTLELAVMCHVAYRLIPFKLTSSSVFSLRKTDPYSYDILIENTLRIHRKILWIVSQTIKRQKVKIYLLYQ